MSLYGNAVVVLEDPTEDEWLAARTSGVGASEVAAVVGLSPYESNVDLYTRKVHPGPEWEGNEATRLGHRFEEVIAQDAAEKLGLEIIGPPMSAHHEGRAKVLLQHPDLPYVLCSPDRIARDKDGRIGPFEIKMTAGPAVAADWDDDATPYAAALQLCQQCTVTGHDIGWVGALVGGYGWRTEGRTWLFDQAISESLIAKVSEFWQAVQDQTPPEPLGNMAQARAAQAELFSALDIGGAQEIDLETIALVDQLVEKKAEQSQIKKQVEHLAAEVQHRLLISEAAVGLVDGHEYVTYRPQSSTRVKPDLVKAAFPDTWTEFAETTESRVLRTPRKGRA